MLLNRVHQVEDRVTIRNVLISVADKRGIAECAARLWEVHPVLRIYSTGGTHALLHAVAERCGTHDRLIAISDFTRQPEMHGGLVKTLDYRIYLGILAEADNEAHRFDVERTDAVLFDAVICNFYPFERAVQETDHTLEDARANIDIGGPTMLRAAAKNYLRVAAICNPADYGAVIEAAANSSSLVQRFRWAQTAFAHVAAYDTAISSYFDRSVESQLSCYRPARGAACE